MRIGVILCFLIILASCKDSGPNLNEMDLMQHGMPIKINAPLDATVTSEDYGFMKDITIKKGDNYYLQILSSDAIDIDPKKIKAEELTTIKNAPYFSKVIQDDETGFIFEKTRIDSSLNYDFRQIRIQGDKKYIFQAGMIGLFTEEDIRNMYSSVQ